MVQSQVRVKRVEEILRLDDAHLSNLHPFDRLAGPAEPHNGSVILQLAIGAIYHDRPHVIAAPELERNLARTEFSDGLT